MSTVWFDHGLSSVADALAMANEERLEGLRLIASHRDRHAPALRLADEAFVEPTFDTDGPAARRASLDWCLAVCRERRVDVFAVQSRQRWLAGHAGAFTRIGTRLLVAGTPDVLETIDDKTRFHAAATAVGLPMPRTLEVDGPAAFDAALARLADECRTGEGGVCIKPPRGIFGAGYWRLDERVTAFGALMDPDARRLPARVVRDALAAAREPLRLLVLEFLPGPEWSVDCLCDDGRLHAAVARLKSGRVQRLAVEGAPIELARRTVAAFGLSGLINVQLRSADADPAGDLRVLEVNARMSGGCLYTRASGVNLPWWHLALATGARSPAELPALRGGALVAPRTVAVEVAPSDEGARTGASGDELGPLPDA